MQSYEDIKNLHATLPAFAPIVPTQWLPSLSFILLASTFVLAFFFSTLPTPTVPVKEIGVAALASVLAGLGIVALFCSAGVYV
ncbi:hypothetical protein FRB94_004523 [Tulasnella sp. JGI-2019a]|nr:hypothetical protein FRB93_003162 [Tulasnella sp. JGI-2019a]KAG9001808.1 hypothetical protein FRB94_004523 [Tulasnella sp. JGI-2019a]KAG9033040.1 hypothetical protein FRB95_000625 [Tulasnella sp. JGI-2019a]